MILYRIGRALFRIALRGFFRQIDVEGLERIPRSGPVLIVSNHTNAFVDPLILLTRLRRPITLTAKSTLAGKALLNPAIRMMGVVLLARRQDGIKDAHANDDALAELSDVLKRGGVVYIFPEGESHSDPHIHPFRTGAARIAFEHIEHGNEDLTIVPVGLHYEQKDRWRSRASALVGMPWSLRAWRERHPQSTARELTATLEQQVKDLALSFGSSEERDVVLQTLTLIEGASDGAARIDQVAPLNASQRANLVQRLQAGLAWLRLHHAARLHHLSAESTKLRHDLQRVGVSPTELWLLMQWGRAAFFTIREIEITLVGAPLAAWGWINFLPAYLLTRTLVRRMSRDEDHWASNAVFVSIPIFSLWTLLLAIPLLLFVPAPWNWIWLASLPLAAAIALHYRDRTAGAWQRIGAFMRFRTHPDLQHKLQDRVARFVAELRTLESEMKS